MCRFAGGETPVGGENEIWTWRVACSGKKKSLPKKRFSRESPMGVWRDRNIGGS